jgi:energy-coupling factor transport system ATP-binding protein
LLRWDNVTFAYEQSGKNNILDNASLELEPGRITVITGASGCGKSTLLYLAAGLYPKNAGILKSGRVTVCGEETGDIPPERRADIIGMVFQNPDLQFCMDTVENEIIFCLENVSCPPFEMDGKISAALEFCGIERLRTRKLVSLSGGEKQKAMLACIVALGPKWLVLDEPFANIDPAAAGDIALRLREMKRLNGTGIVAVDHHLDVWTDIADEIVVMEAGGSIAMKGIDPKQLPGQELTALGVATPGTRYQREMPAKPLARPEAVLEIEGLSVDFGGEPVLHGASARFYHGRIHAITGGSGSGKSTLFNTLCGLNKYKGVISVLGEPLDRRSRKRLINKMGFVFQNPQDQFVSNSVMGEIKAGFAKGDGSADEKTKEILKSIGLWRYRYVSPYMLSQGHSSAPGRGGPAGKRMRHTGLRRAHIRAGQGVHNRADVVAAGQGRP